MDLALGDVVLVTSLTKSIIVLS